MTYEELLALLDARKEPWYNEVTEDFELADIQLINTIRAVVELHKPITIELCDDEDCCGCGDPDFICSECQSNDYPCPTIQAIEKELQ